MSSARENLGIFQLNIITTGVSVMNGDADENTKVNTLLAYRSTRSPQKRDPSLTAPPTSALIMDFRLLVIYPPSLVLLGRFSRRNSRDSEMVLW